MSKGILYEGPLSRGAFVPDSNRIPVQNVFQVTCMQIHQVLLKHQFMSNCPIIHCLT